MKLTLPAKDGEVWTFCSRALRYWNSREHRLFTVFPDTTLVGVDSFFESLMTYGYKRAK